MHIKFLQMGPGAQWWGPWHPTLGRQGASFVKFVFVY